MKKIQNILIQICRFFMHNLNSFKKKKILVLAGSSDIGIQLIKILLAEGWFVVAHYSSNKNCFNKLKNKNLKTIKLNFKDVNEKNCLKKINIFLKYRLDAYVNLIGYVDNKGLKNTSLKNLFEIFKINTFLPILIMNKLIRIMSKNVYGRLLNCSSIGVKFGGGKESFNYSFSKHSLEFIPSAYKEWSKKNILINNLRIGVTDTKIHKKMKKDKKLEQRVKLIPMKRMASAEEIARYIVFLISEKNSYMTGETLSVSGGE